MKIRVYLISAIVMLLGVCVLASTYTPVAIWPFRSFDAQRTGQNLAVTDVDAKKLKVEWMFPALSEHSDYEIKSLESEGVEIGENWISNQEAGATVDADPDTVWSKNGAGHHFMYVNGEITPAIQDFVTYNFTGLRPGDKYQVFMTVPSKLTKNDEELKLATHQYVRIEFKNDANEDRAGEYTVNVSREEYAGSWLYVTADLITVGPDGKLSVKLSNRGTIASQVEYTDDDGNVTTETEYSDNALCLADAVRIVKVSERKMVGSSVACTFPGDTFILDSDNVSYNEKVWEKVSDKLGIFVNYNGENKFAMTRTEPGSVPVNGSMYILKPDAAATETDKNFTYNFNVAESGKYAVYVNVMTFSKDPFLENGNTYNSFKNYATQKYDIFDGSSVSSAEISMDTPGWSKLGEFGFHKENDCRIVLSVQNLQGYNGGFYTYAADAVRVVKVHDTSVLSDKVNDIGSTPVGISAYNTKLRDASIAKSWSDDFVSKLSFKEVGKISGYTIKATSEIWQYPNIDPNNWDELEGPVVGGFATSPMLAYIADPDDITTTTLATFVGDKNGIIYGFDTEGTNEGNVGNARLLFKGPGIFLPEPFGAGILYKDWSVQGTDESSYGGSYIYTDKENPTPVRFVIDNQMREKAGDYSYFDVHTNLTGYEPNMYSKWKWQIRFWVPLVEGFVGTTMKFQVKWNILNDTIAKEYECKIENKDLGTWKYVSLTDTFSAPSEVNVSVADIPSGNVAIIDNLWITPALPKGEELSFNEGIEFVTDSDKYGETGNFVEMRSENLFAPTGAGRIFAYSLKNGIDTQNKIAKVNWVYPNMEDRKTLDMASAPSYINSYLYFTARPYTSGEKTTKFSLYGINTKTLETIKSEQFDNELGLDHDAWQSGPMNFLPSGTGIGSTYAILGSNGLVGGAYKFSQSNLPSVFASPVNHMDDITGFFQTSPAVASYADKTATASYLITGDRSLLKDKILINDVYGEVSSYELAGPVTADTKSTGFITPEEGKMQNRDVVSNIVTDGHIDELGQLQPHAYFGGADAYMTVFNAVTGEKLTRMIAGMQADVNKSQIQGTPVLIQGADAHGESIINLNGADGYNYTYNYTDYNTNPKHKWNNLPIGANWPDLLNELEVQAVDPSSAEDSGGVQVELIDYNTAINLIDMFNKRSETNSLYSKIISDEKAVFQSVSDTEDTFLRKDMIIIPKDYWSYIQVGEKGGVIQNNLLDTGEKTERLNKYLILEAQKCRMNRDFKGDNKVSGNTNESRALFWELDANSGMKDPRQRKGNSAINLEWGDHLYIAVWNMPLASKLNGASPVVFEYSPAKVPFGSRAAFRPERKVPASVTKIYNFDPYNIKFEDPLDSGEIKAAAIGSAPVTRKLSLIEITLDCNANKIQSMIGSGWKMGIDLQLPKQSGKVFRFPIGTLTKSTLADDYAPEIQTEESTWVKVDPQGFREEFVVNNPLSLRVDGKEFGKTYKRYDDANSYNAINGVKDSDVVTVSLGNFVHGYLSKLSDVADVANRSAKDIDACRFYPTNHVATDVLSDGSTNHLSDPMPWEYGIGSADYPNIDYKNVEVIDGDGEDMIYYDSLLKTDKPWANVIGKDPYVNDRTGNVFENGNKKTLNLRYQIDVPRYQPAMKSYVADAVIYVDTNGNGKFDLSGSYDNPFINCEAHRRFKVDFGVLPKAEMFVEEDDIYLGDAGHGLGYPLALNGIFTPYQEHALGLQTDAAGNVKSYNPFNTKPEVMKWFKSFTVYNDGNVNLFDLSLNKEPLYAKAGNKNMTMYQEGVEHSGYTDEKQDMLRIHENNVISSFDFAAKSDRINGGVSGFIGANYPFSSNGANFGGSANSFTITKPRVGDVFGTTMTVPDTRKITGRPFFKNNDYNRKVGGNNYEMDVRDAQAPMVAVTVPVGQAIGEYATVHPITANAKFSDKGQIQNISSHNGFNLDINVKEAQITGTPFDKNTAHASLYNIGGSNDATAALNYYKYYDDRDTTPFAFQKKNGNVAMLWSNNMVANDIVDKNSNVLDEDTEEIDSARMPLNISFGELKDIKDTESVVAGTNETNNFYNRDQWWDYGSFRIRENGWPNDLGNGYDVPKWVDNANIKSSFLQYPSYYSDGNVERIVFSGKAELKNVEGGSNEILPNEFDNRIFWLDYNFTGDEPNAIPLYHLDSYSEKKYPVMTMRNNNNWFFWQSSLDGKPSISFTTNDLPANYVGAIDGYSPEAKVRVPASISSAGKPNVIDRDPSDNMIELIYTGVNKVTGGTDVYMGQYSLDVNSMDNQTIGLSERAMPLKRVYDEMRRDSKYDFYVGKGLAWLRQDVTGNIADENLPAVVVGLGGAPEAANHDKYIDIFTGNSGNTFNIDDWKNGLYNNLPLFKSLAPAENSIYPKFTFDDATGVMTIEYAPGSDAEIELGKTLVDFSSGVIRFTRLANIMETKETANSAIYKKPATVYASYVPQTISLTEGNGINDGGFAIYDTKYEDVLVMWRKSQASAGDGVYYKIFKPSQDNHGRLDYQCIYNDKRVLTDSSLTNINDNSLSGFFDRRVKGNADGTGYGKLWLFWSGTKSGKTAVYYETEAIDESLL